MLRLDLDKSIVHRHRLKSVYGQFRSYHIVLTLPLLKTPHISTDTMTEWRGYTADQLLCVDCQQQYVQSRVTLARISTLYFPHMWCASQIRLNIYYGRFTRFNNTTAAEVMRYCRVMVFICEVCHMMHPCNVVCLRICYQSLAVLCDFFVHIHKGCSAASQWRHNGCDGVSNHQPHDCFLNR